MSRTTLYALIGMLAIAVVGLGIWMYQEKSREVLQLDLGGNRVTIQQR